MAEDNKYRQDQSNQDWRPQRDRNREQDYNTSNENKYESGFDYEQRRRLEQDNNFGNTGNMDSGGQYDQRDRFRNQRNDWNSNDWNNNQQQSRNSSQDWNQRNTNSGYGSSNQYGRRDQGQYGSYGSGYQGDRQHMRGSIYGDDTRNYGNANQGAFDRNWWERTKDEVSSWFGDSDAERRRRQDDQVSGQHKGKGPRGYQRSEERIKEDVCDRLCDHPTVDATNINIEVSGTEVVLTGTVSSKEEKRRAEDIAESVSGVRNVENRIKVSETSTGSNTGGKRDSESSIR